MKKFTMLFSVILCFSVMFTSACAGVKGNMIQKNKQKQAGLESMAKGKEFSSRGVNYVILPEARSKMTSSSLNSVSSENRRAEIKRVVSSNSEIELIEDRGNVIFYKESSSAPAAKNATLKEKIAASHFQNSGYPVVQNQKNGWLGVISGNIRVKLYAFGKVGKVAEDHGLRIKAALKHIETAFLYVMANQDIVEIWRSLKKDPRIKEADIEVVEHFKRLR